LGEQREVGVPRVQAGRDAQKDLGSGCRSGRAFFDVLVKELDSTAEKDTQP